MISANPTPNHNAGLRTKLKKSKCIVTLVDTRLLLVCEWFELKDIV